MLRLVRAFVTALTRADADAVEGLAMAEGESEPRRIVAYPALTGPLTVGDAVVLNATATGLGLGTGGVDFVVRNESRPLPETVGLSDRGDEHIVKLRYTPVQHAVTACEMDPRHADGWESADDLGGMPVVVCGLHSQIAPAAAAVKAARPAARVAYVLTDGAALPLAFSRLVRDLRAAGLLDATLTAGQAFGGEYECVTVPSALLAARHLARADVTIVAQGPGNAGTGTRYGFSGIEQGWLMDIAGALGGSAIGVLRLSSADPRPRHLGLSHHSVTALGRIASRRAVVAFPAGPDWAEVRAAVDASPIVTAARHRVEETDGAPGLALLAERGLRVTSMGRGVDADPLFFHAAAAAGAVAARNL
jgi:hypothetical protein